MMILILSVSIFVVVESVCPNNCSGHGTCKKSVCECFTNVGIDGSKSYGGADCSEHICFYGNPFGAVHSKNPSENGIVSYSSNVNRELSESNVNERRVEEVTVLPSISLISRIKDDNNNLWKVSGLSSFQDVLPPSGGILRCSFYKADDPAAELDGENAPTTVDIQSFGDGYEYVLFKDPVIRIGDTPNTDGDKTYSKVECDRIISTRDDLSQFKPTTVTVGSPAQDPLTFKWELYGPILLDMGLLTPDSKTENKYVNENFRFACYETSPTTNTEVKICDKVEAVYDTTLTDSSKVKDVTFTFNGNIKPTATSICLCLMNSYGSIDIEYSEAYNNIRKGSDNKYYIGKYTTTADTTVIENEDNYPVAVTSTDLSTTSGVFTITFADSSNDKEYKQYFDVNRVVYATILSGGIFSEKDVEIGNSNSVTIDGDGGVVMPYLRTSPLSELTPLPEANTGTAISSSEPYLYKAYYFAEDLLHSFNKEGGILKCKYTKTGDSVTPEDVTIDVKGIARNDQVIFYSYIEFKASDLQASELYCYDIGYKRKDLTLLNPSIIKKITVSQRQLTDSYVIEWSNYISLFKLYDVKSPVNFACFDMKSSTKELNVYSSTVNSITDDKITFTVDITPSDDSEYLCYLLSIFSSATSLELKDLSNSEIGNRIIASSDNKEFYYGEFILGDKTVLGKRYDDSEVIILNKDSKIEFSVSDSKTIITITKYQTDNVVIADKLTVISKFFLKMINTASQFDEKYVEFTVGEISIATDTVTITTTVDKSSEVGSYSPFYVIYLSQIQPSEIPTTPPQPQPTVTVIDIDKNLYKISNYLDEELLKKLSIIGGKLQCKNDKKSEIVDVKGVIKNNNKIENVFYQFETSESKDEIESCKYLSSRKDMTLYNPLKYTKGSNYIRMKGYGTILSEIKYSYSKKNMTCYNPKIEDVNNRKLSFYEVTLSNIKQNDKIDDLKISFNGKTPDDDNICYLLSDVNGNEISILNSELWSLIREDEKGDYYFGKNEIKANGKSEERKKEDGSVKITFSSEAFFTNAGGDADDNGEKMNLFNLNTEENPSFEIPPSFIEAESKKMLQPGTTVTFTFTSGIEVITSSAQILRIETKTVNGKERLKIFLSNSIYIPIEGRRMRLRSLDTISSDLLVDLEWSSEGSTHISLECSGQGECDRESGICKCYEGYSGSGCQRLDCPNNCNGNGRCVALSELLSNSDLKEYKGYGNKHIGEYIDSSNKAQDVQFDDQVYGCLCDKRHRGYDCTLIECPSGEDPEGGSNINKAGKDEYRDCSGRGICNYLSGICECFDGFSGEGCQTMVQMM